jgi:hypothetical protein
MVPQTIENWIDELTQAARNVILRDPTELIFLAHAPAVIYESYSVEEIETCLSWVPELLCLNKRYDVEYDSDNHLVKVSRASSVPSENISENDI